MNLRLAFFFLHAIQLIPFYHVRVVIRIDAHFEIFEKKFQYTTINKRANEINRTGEMRARFLLKSISVNQQVVTHVCFRITVVRNSNAQ